VGRGFSPLDDELELLPGSLTPTLVEGLSRLGAWATFEPAAAMLEHFTRVRVSKATSVRTAERAGEAYVAIQAAEVERLEKELPESPEGPAVQQLSVDGAMVPLVGGAWAEVKTLAIGTVKVEVVKGELGVHTEEISYFSRMTDHETFERLATVETHRRGTEKAGLVGAVNDGAEWEQGFVDTQRPDAVRILDWGHATEHLSAGAQAVLGAGTAETSEWLSVQLHELKHGDSDGVLSALRGLRDSLLVPAGGQDGGEDHEGVSGGEDAFEVAAGREQDFKVVSQNLEYLEKRRDQIRYAEFIAAGLPIGSGIVESANKLVVEARLKGAGMHWEGGHVNPMVALRNVVCSDRWDEAWAAIAERLRLGPRERAEARRAQHQRDEAALTRAAVPERAETEPRQEPIPVPMAARQEPVPTGVVVGPASGPRRPAPDHPWRRMAIGRAQRAA
jgi:hypothetical protein